MFNNSNSKQLAKILICGLCNKVFIREPNLIEHLKTHVALAMHIALASGSGAGGGGGDGSTDEIYSLGSSDGASSELRLRAAVCTLKVELCNAPLADETTPAPMPINPKIAGTNSTNSHTVPAAAPQTDSAQQQQEQQVAIDETAAASDCETQRIPEDAIQSREPCPTSDQVSVLRLSRLVNKYRRKLAFECRICGRQFRYQLAATDHVNRQHSNRRPFKCRYCGISCRSSPARSLHEKRKHRKQLQQQQKLRQKQQKKAQDDDRREKQTDSRNMETASPENDAREWGRDSDVEIEEEEAYQSASDLQASQPAKLAALPPAALTASSRQQQQQQLHQQLLFSAAEVDRQRLHLTSVATSSAPQLIQSRGMRVMPCPQCPMTFTDIGLLARHVQIHGELQQQHHQPHRQLLFQQQPQQRLLSEASSIASLSQSSLARPAGPVPVSMATWLTPQPRLTADQPLSKGIQLVQPVPPRTQLPPQQPGFLRPRAPLPIPLTLAALQQQQQQQQQQLQQQKQHLALSAGYLPAFIYSGNGGPNLRPQLQLQQQQQQQQSQQLLQQQRQSLSQRPVQTRLLPMVRLQPIQSTAQDHSAPSSSK